MIGESYFVLGIRARQACHRLSASANKQFFLLKPSCSSEYEHLSHLSLSLQQRSASHRPLASANPSLTQSSRSIMENLALHSADEPDDLRATTGTVEVIIISYKRSSYKRSALAQEARPIHQHEPAARHTILFITASLSLNSPGSNRCRTLLHVLLSKLSNPVTSFPSYGLLYG